MDEESVTNSIPIQKFTPNHLSKKEKPNEASFDVNVSPNSALATRDTNFKNIDHPSYLAAVAGKMSLSESAPS